jgi:hypothetical protein
MAEDTNEFLILIERDYYLSELSTLARGGLEVRGTQIISAAQHLDFVKADRTCMHLRRHGYPMATVTNVLGAPITAGLLRGEIPNPADALPRSLADLDRLPAATYKRRMQSEAAFAGRVQELIVTEGRSQRS